MRYLSPFSIPALALALAMPGLAHAKSQPLNVQIGDRNGICSVAVPAGENGLKLEFAIRARDFNVNVTLHNVPGDIVNAALDKGSKPDIDLIFDGGRRHELDWGEYVAGFTYRLVGGWDDAVLAADMLDELKTVSTVIFRAGDNRWGPISLQQKGVIYNILKQCVSKNLGQGNN